MGGKRPQVLKKIESLLWQAILHLAQPDGGDTVRTLKSAFEQIDGCLGEGVDVVDIDWFDRGQELQLASCYRCLTRKLAHVEEDTMDVEDEDEQNSCGKQNNRCLSFITCIADDKMDIDDGPMQAGKGLGFDECHNPAETEENQGAMVIDKVHPDVRSGHGPPWPVTQRLKRARSPGRSGRNPIDLTSESQFYIDGKMCEIIDLTDDDV